MRRPLLPILLLSCGMIAGLLCCLFDFPLPSVDAAPRRSRKPIVIQPVNKPLPALDASAECRWAATPIVLDGKADEPVWAKAQVIDNFGRPWLQGDSGLTGKTQARLLWDSDYLYFFADMQDFDLFADVKTHDGAIWTNDAFELFLRPDAEKPGYYEFEINAANSVMDAFYPRRDLDTALSQLKNGEFRVETKVHLRGTLNEPENADKGWSVEGRIPWVDFLRTGGRPEPDEVWPFNLCRYNHDQNKRVEISCTAPIRQVRMSAFVHQIENFAGLKFVGPEQGAAAMHGLSKHVPVTSSTVIGAPEPPPYRTKRLYPDFSPTYPLLLKPIPGTDQLLGISENMEAGHTKVWCVPDDPKICNSDVRLLFETPDNGLAYDACFHPRFVDNHYVYFAWAGDFKGKRKDKMCRVTRYTVDTREPITIDQESATTIIEWESDGHNGLAMCFGSDGMFYVTSGDGSNDSDTDEMGQSTESLLSKVMRIDVDHPPEGQPYAVPSDNPYVNDRRFAPETWAYGMRNPWRMTADPKTGHIWVGNNGQDQWEQVYLVQKGANYGWSVSEGGHPFLSERTRGPHPITKPTIDQPHAEFRSLTGGTVLYDKQFPELEGTYLYGDYSTGRIWGMKHDGTRPLSHKELAFTRLQIAYFSQNHQGELIICDHSPKGGIYTLERIPSDPMATRFPRKLSESGLFESIPDHRMKPGVIPYSVNAPFWSDGMHKERFIALTGMEPINNVSGRGWNFPNRTVLVKSFAFERKPGDPTSRKWIETRFLTKQDGEWCGYSYLWNEAGTDADLVDAGGRDEKFSVPTMGGVREQIWHYPSRAECMACHTRASNFVLGVTSVQMNKMHDYGRCQENQFSALQFAGLISGIDWPSYAREKIAERAAARNLSGTELTEYLALNGQQGAQRYPPAATILPIRGDHLPHLVNPYDSQEDLTKRARSWLHVNCSICHVAAGGGNSRMELEFGLPVASMRIMDTKPQHTTFGITDACVIASGAPDRSVLMKRISVRGRSQMPPLSTNRIDEPGVALMREWIESLKK